MKKTLKVIGIGLAGLFILVLIVSLFPNSEKKLQEVNNNLKETNQKLEQEIEQKTQTINPTQDKTWAEKLAQLDTNNSNPDKTLVNGFTNILTRLTDKCGENEEWVSDRIINGQNKLKEYAVKASLMEIARGFDGATGNGDSCNEVFALYLTGRVRGE